MLALGLRSLTPLFTQAYEKATENTPTEMHIQSEFQLFKVNPSPLSPASSNISADVTLCLEHGD